MRRHAKAPIAVLIAMLVLGVSAAVALQTHKQGSDVGTPPDSSSFAGLAVAPSGDLFAADAGANRVDRYDSAGTFELTWGGGVVSSGPGNLPTNEQQVVTVDATGGTFTLAYEGEQTSDVAFDASAAAVQAALEAIPSLGAGNISVTGSAGGPWTVEFTGAKADTDVSELSADPTNLTGGAQSASVSTSVQGASAFEVCDPSGGDTCRQGFAGNGEGQMSNPQDVATDSTGNVFVADAGNNRVLGFDGSGALLSSVSGDGSLDGSGLPSPFSSFSSPCGVAVDQANDNLFVADQGNNRIWIFDSTGTYLDQIADSSLQGPCGLALDLTGNLYVRNANDGKVLRFDRSSATEYAFNSVFYSAEEGGASDVAIDTANDHVYVNRGDRIAEYEASGSPVSTFGQDTLCCSGGIAVDSANQRIYASEFGAIHVFGPLIVLPEATTGPASDITGESATISGTIDPAGGPSADCEFEYGSGVVFGGPPIYDQSAPCDPAGPFSSAEVVTASLSGLDPATTYHYRLHASSSDGSVTGADRTFTTNGPPVIKQFFAIEVGGSEATLQAAIDPAGLQTSYRFQYVTQAEFEADGFDNATEVPVPDGEIAPISDEEVKQGQKEGVAISSRTVTQTITGLTPATVYRFRVLAENALDEATSDSKVFRTFAPHTSGPGRFPGQGFLPENRAWELVSPPEKLGSDINLTTSRIRISDDGSAASFSSLGAFADALGGGVAVDYLANRTGEGNGWSTHATSPPQDALSQPAIAALIDPRYYGDFSPDLNRGVFLARSPLTDDANVAEVPNIYLRTDMRSSGRGSYELLSACPLCAEAGQPLPASNFNDIAAQRVGPEVSPLAADVTPDLSKVAFESRQRLTADTPEPPGACDLKSISMVYFCSFQAYVSDGSELDYVGRIPAFPATSCDDDGGPACEGAPISRLGQGVLRSKFVPEMISAPDTISDGSDGHTRVFFTLPTEDGQTPNFFPDAASGNLYARIDNTQTVQLNASERTDCAGDPSCGGDGEPDPAPDTYVPVRYVGAAADGTRAFFTTEEALSDDAPGPVGNPGEGLSEKLYMYDLSKPASDPHNLTLINADSVPSDGYALLGFIGASDDGRYVYFEADGDLLPGESTGATDFRSVSECGNPCKAGIYLWHDGDLTYIGSGEKWKRQSQFSPGGPLMGGRDNQAIAEPNSSPTMARVTPDGRHLLFVSYHGEGLLSVRDGTDHECLGECRELYLYSAEGDRLQCASCDPTGAATIGGNGAADVVASQVGRGSTRGDWHLTNPLSDDGRYVFFSSTERLAAADRNGPCKLVNSVGGGSSRRLPNEERSTCTDAYVFDSASGEISLLSSGESNTSSFFLEASPDGRNALIGTRERLSAWDFDGSYDVYDARIGGGFPEPPPPPPTCEGDACQPAPLALNDPTPASSSFSGPGNHKPRKACRKNERRTRKGQKQRRGKQKRCVNRKGRTSR